MAMEISVRERARVSVAGIPGATGMPALAARVVTWAGSVIWLDTSSFHADIEYHVFRPGKTIQVGSSNFLRFSDIPLLLLVKNFKR